MKVCNICKVEKELFEFAIRKEGTHRNDCKQCRSLYLREYRKGNKDNPYKLQPKITKVCRVCSIEKIVDEFVKSKRICKHCQKQYLKDRYLKNREEELNKSKVNYQLNKDYIKERNRNYSKNNREKINKTIRKYKDEVLKKDPLWVIKNRVSIKIRRCLKNLGSTKSKSTLQIIGCTLEEFKIHIESLFQEGMSWENKSLWDIDHVVPLAFAENENEIILLNHYSNLRPLWRRENILKSDNIIIKNDIYYKILELRLLS